MNLRTLRRMYSHVLKSKVISTTRNCSKETVVFIYTLSGR